MPHLSTLFPRIAAALAVAALLGFHGAAAAQQFCSEPVAPYCVDKDSEFDSMLQINRCVDDLDDYQQQVDEYEQCISGQLEQMRTELSEARNKLREAEKNF